MRHFFNYQRVATTTATTRQSHVQVHAKVIAMQEEDITKDRPTPGFGSRYLTNVEKIWDHNAWDHVEFGPTQEQEAREQIARQKQASIDPEKQKYYHENAAKFWDEFYKNNENRFFKDRNWVRIEFAEVHSYTHKESGSRRVLEVGCGAGNTLFPLLHDNQNPELFIYAADFSPEAVQVVKSNHQYDEKHARAFVWDMASENTPDDIIPPGSLDVVVLIFVFSALHPDAWERAVNNVYKMLKPGGKVLLRDYGRYDMTQLRFKGSRLLADNFYVRGDGTRVYYFTEEEIRSIFGRKFRIDQCAADRKLITNRLRKLKMYRIWYQGKFVKES